MEYFLNGRRDATRRWCHQLCKLTTNARCSLSLSLYLAHSLIPLLAVFRMPRFLLQCCVLCYFMPVLLLLLLLLLLFFCKLFGQTIANCAALEIWSMQPLRAQEIQIAPLNTSTLASLLLSFYKYVNKHTYIQTKI